MTGLEFLFAALCIAVVLFVSVFVGYVHGRTAERNGWIDASKKGSVIKKDAEYVVVEVFRTPDNKINERVWQHQSTAE